MGNMDNINKKKTIEKRIIICLLSVITLMVLILAGRIVISWINSGRIDAIHSDASNVHSSAKFYFTDMKEKGFSIEEHSDITKIGIIFNDRDVWSGGDVLENAMFTDSDFKDSDKYVSFDWIMSETFFTPTGRAVVWADESGIAAVAWCRGTTAPTVEYTVNGWDGLHDEKYSIQKSGGFVGLYPYPY